jgi:hypothetical protein
MGSKRGTWRSKARHLLSVQPNGDLHGAISRHLKRALDELDDLERQLAEARAPAEHPDDLLDLLRKLAHGTGGRRTGELRRRGWLRWEVTGEGHEALRGVTGEGPTDDE